MDGMATLRATIIGLREDAKISQAELAKRLGCAASKVSRFESGEIQLSLDEVRVMALKIAENFPPAALFADYLGWEWKILDQPSFRHPSLSALRNAELSLQKLESPLNDPEIKNVFVQQLRSCDEGLRRLANFLADTEHGIAFVGPPKVGKSTAICALSNLRDPSQKELGDQMALKTGGGRVTVCEVHVRQGDGYGIRVTPCKSEEIEQYVHEFCEDLKTSSSIDGGRKSGDSPGLSAEVERAIRNLAKLPRPRTQMGKDGNPAEDLAAELARNLSDEDLFVEVMTRLELPRRSIRTSIGYEPASATSGLHWLKETFSKINFGLHQDFSLPRLIEVFVPEPIFGESPFKIRLIDTRGNDEPAAPRRDLQAYLEDPRTLIVLCTGFGDAPDGASQALIERAADQSMQSPLISKGLLLVLAKNDEERTVLNESTGEAVANDVEGREIRRYEAQSKLRSLGASFIPVGFLNVISPDDCQNISRQLVGLIDTMRRRQENHINELVGTVEKLLSNKKLGERRAIFDSAIRPLQVWFESNQKLDKIDHDIESRLLRDMRTIGHVGYLRAAVNRRGRGDNFDYWLGLGLGARQHAVAQTTEQLTILNGIIRNTIEDPDASEAHGFLKHFQSQVDEAIREFYRQVQSVGETAFSEQLRGDGTFWSKCQIRWGSGKGYKDDVLCWTQEWFAEEVEHRKERFEYIDKEIKRRWRDMLARLSIQLKSADATP